MIRLDVVIPPLNDDLLALDEEIDRFVQIFPAFQRCCGFNNLLDAMHRFCHEMRGVIQLARIKRG